jgi:hypothetical protein
MKFCICFFGVISMSLQYTIDSINKNILDVLTKNNIEYDVYMHNNIVNNIGKIQINNTNYKLLKPNKYIEEDQILIDTKIQKYLHNVCDKYVNAIRAIYSVKCVTELWENDTEYDLYLYLRPDLLYTNEIDISHILENINKENVLFTPNWHKWGGLNDRIYFGKKDVMTKIGKRIDLIPTILKTKYHSEQFLKIAVDHYAIDTIDISLRGDRIRSCGTNHENACHAYKIEKMIRDKELKEKKREEKLKIKKQLKNHRNKIKNIKKKLPSRLNITKYKNLKKIIIKKRMKIKHLNKMINDK